MRSLSELRAVYSRILYGFLMKYNPYQMPRFYQYGLTAEDIIGVRNTPWCFEGYKRLPPEQVDEFNKRAIIASHHMIFDEPLPVDQWVKPEEEKTVLIDNTLVVMRETIEKMYWDKI
ncbi:hypothetical protein RF11_03233 [Thelohanellus kitauei]|uniref:Cytochrome b-c1 complex subunit 7 n=1 Tax=Thelohanellus kitauei TaxID=669202 RepID=A0A0C2J518_THEKT|nr:hypothetical protein RF11_03233 [Thelohanellus kitauei]